METWYNKSSQLTEKLIDLMKLKEQQNGITGIPSGFNKLDLYTEGWQHGTLTILAARPGMGKQAFINSMVYQMAVIAKTPVAYFSFENSSSSVITRLISIGTNICLNRLKFDELTIENWKSINFFAQKLSKSPLYISEKPVESSKELRRRILHFVSIGVKFIVVDNIQMIHFENCKYKNKSTAFIPKLFRQLKHLAENENITIVLLSNLAKTADVKFTLRRPLISELPYHKSIIKYTDLILFLYRPEYYKVKFWENYTSTENKAELIIKWNKNGFESIIPLNFLPIIGKFEEENQLIRHQLS